MVLSTFKIIDSSAPILRDISNYLLPSSLFLLLIPVDVKAILRLGKVALLMFFAGSFGMMIGIPTAFFVFKQWVGTE